MNLYKHIYINIYIYIYTYILIYILFRYNIVGIGEIQTHIPFDIMLNYRLSQKFNLNLYPCSITKYFIIFFFRTETLPIKLTKNHKNHKFHVIRI